MVLHWWYIFYSYYIRYSNCYLFWCSTFTDMLFNTLVCLYIKFKYAFWKDFYLILLCNQMSCSSLQPDVIFLFATRCHIPLCNQMSYSSLQPNIIFLFATRCHIPLCNQMSYSSLQPNVIFLFATRCHMPLCNQMSYSSLQPNVIFLFATRCHIPLCNQMSYSSLQPDVIFLFATRCHIPLCNQMSYSSLQPNIIFLQGVRQKFKPHHVLIKLGILQPSTTSLPSQLPFYSLQTYFSNPSFLPFPGHATMKSFGITKILHWWNTSPRPTRQK